MAYKKNANRYQTTGVKPCGNCGKTKPVSEFDRRMSGRYAGAVMSYCHDCNLAKVYAWSKTHPGATTKRNHANGKCQSYTVSKDCHMWIGVHITERLALLFFNEYHQMPIGNPNYDLINQSGETIDCKASHLRRISHDYLGWQFVIDRNDRTDLFFCVAFGSEKECAPMHAWAIPAEKIAHLKRLSIYERKISGWASYELPLNQVVSYWCEVI